MIPGIAFAVLVLIAAILYVRRLRTRRVGADLTDAMIERIESNGRLEMDEPLDHDEIRQEEERFWEEERWDEAEEM